MKQLKSYVTLGDAHYDDDDALQNKNRYPISSWMEIIGANT